MARLCNILSVTRGDKGEGKDDGLYEASFAEHYGMARYKRRGGVMNVREETPKRAEKEGQEGLYRP